MRTCDFTESYCYDPTGEMAEPCGRPTVAECEQCGCDVCLGHGQLCACGFTFCDSCRAAHESECEAFKLDLYLKTKRYTEPLTQ